MPELEQPPVQGLQVERAPVPHARRAHARDVARKRRPHRLADALAGAEVDTGVEVTRAVLAEPAVDGERRGERRHPGPGEEQGRPRPRRAPCPPRSPPRPPPPPPRRGRAQSLPPA